MVPYRVANHVERGKALILAQYRDRPLFTAWLVSYLRQVQCLEDATYDVILSRYLDRATHAQLDLIGKLVGEERLGRADGVYRIFIAARIRINRSFGRAQDLYDVYNIICDAPKTFTDVPPANILLELLEPPNIDPALLLGMLRDTKAAGVGLQMVVATAPPSEQFLWGTVGCEDTPSPNGFGDVNDETTGGRLASVMS